MRKKFVIKRGLIFFKTLNSVLLSAQWDLNPAGIIIVFMMIEKILCVDKIKLKQTAVRSGDVKASFRWTPIIVM